MTRSEELIAAYLDDALTEAEQAELTAWLQADAANVRAFVEANAREQQIRAAVQAHGNLQLVQQRAPAASTIVPVPASVWRARAVWAAAAAVVLLAAVWMFGPRPAPQIARLGGNLAGVTVERAGATLAAAAGMRLQEGDVVKAQSGGARIEFSGEDTRFTLASGSVVALRELSGRKRFELVSGSVDAEVAKQNEGAMVWTTDDAEAQIIGTKFTLSAEGLFTRLDVAEGSVAFAQRATAKSTLVQAKEFAAADAHTLVEARPIAEAANEAWSVTTRSSPGFEHATFRSERVGQEVGVNVMLPPGYDAQPQRRFPALYLLHGLGGDEHTEAIRFGAVLREAMSQGLLPPCLVVVPNGGPGFPRQPMFANQMIARELPRFIDTRYRTRASRDGRVICGLGYGAQQAIIVAMFHAEMFPLGCGVDDTLRGGTPGFRRMRNMMQQRNARQPAEVLLLRSRNQIASHSETLAAFLREIGADVRTESIAVASLNDAALPGALLQALAPKLTQQWPPPPQ